MPLNKYVRFNKPLKIPKDYELMVSLLIDARSKRELSQEKLAHRIGCTASLVHKWETHKRIPSGFMLICWLDALGYDITVTER